MTYQHNCQRTHSETRTTDARKNSRPLLALLLSISGSVRHKVGKLRPVALDDANLPSISADAHKQNIQQKKIFSRPFYARLNFKFVLHVVFFLSSVCYAESNDDAWNYRVASYTTSSTPYFFAWTPGGDLEYSQLQAASSFPLSIVLSSGDPVVSGLPTYAVVSNSVTGVVLENSANIDRATTTGGATLYNVIYQLVASLVRSGYSPEPYCSEFRTDGNYIRCRRFRTYPYVASAWFASPSYRESILTSFSVLGNNSSNILQQVISLGSLVEDIGNNLSELQGAALDISQSVDSLATALAPSASNLAERIYISGLMGGGTPYYWLHALGYDNQFTFSANGFVQTATPMGMDLLQQKYAASASYDADRQQLINSLMGYRINGDNYTHDGASNFSLDGRTLDMTDLQAATLPELWSYQARVNMAVNTNDVRRLGQSLVDPDSASNVRKRALDQQSTQDAIANALNNRVIPVNVQNWPVDGIKVKFDDPTIELAGGQYSTVQSIDTNLQQLRTAFKTWSGVDDGGRWLPVQDSVLTNLYAIAESLLSLTNRNNDVSNILYSVATSNQLHEIQSESDAFLAQAENDYHEISGLFDAERYIDFRHTNLNFLASSQFAPLRQLAVNGSQLPDYVNLQIGAFGDYQFPTVTVNVSHVAPICNASRWFFRCVWIVLSCLFYWFLGVYAFRFYKWVTGKFAGMGYYMS